MDYTQANKVVKMYIRTVRTGNVNLWGIKFNLNIFIEIKIK